MAKKGEFFDGHKFNIYDQEGNQIPFYTPCELKLPITRVKDYERATGNIKADWFMLPDELELFDELLNWFYSTLTDEEKKAMGL